MLTVVTVGAVWPPEVDQLRPNQSRQEGGGPHWVTRVDLVHKAGWNRSFKLAVCRREMDHSQNGPHPSNADLYFA
jgi:hypothetical protein